MRLSKEDTLADWLSWLEGLHPCEIDLGLERVARVRDAMKLTPDFPIIIVGGTNGKGSVVALLSTILACAGYKVGAYTSPHILHYNERVTIDRLPVSDARLVRSFDAVESARDQVALTYFEFGTLAAMHTFIDERVDVAVLEVGLGGRLDAVNVFDADVAVVVSVDLDHQAFLGDNREAIGFEKAGIFRAGKPAICADPSPPVRLITSAEATGAVLQCIHRDFGFTQFDHQWTFHCGAHQRYALPLPALRGQHQLGNAAAALAVLDALASRLPVNLGAIKRGLVDVEWPGRFQVLAGRPLVILDVGHNPHAVRAMLANLRALPFARQSYAVFAMLADKDMEAVVALAQEEIDEWFIGGLSGPRGQSAEAIAARMQGVGIHTFKTWPTVSEAWQAALSVATENDRIIVFGSFHTVAAVMAARRNR